MSGCRICSALSLKYSAFQSISVILFATWIDVVCTCAIDIV